MINIDHAQGIFVAHYLFMLNISAKCDDPQINNGKASSGLPDLLYYQSDTGDYGYGDYDGHYSGTQMDVQCHPEYNFKDTKQATGTITCKVENCQAFWDPSNVCTAGKYTGCVRLFLLVYTSEA